MPSFAGGRRCLPEKTVEQFPLQGCDSGFGHVLAKRLSEAGVKVFAGVLDVSGAGAQQLRERGSENLQVLQLDVTESSQIETAHRHICTQVADTGETTSVQTPCGFYGGAPGQHLWNQIPQSRLRYL